MSLVAYRNTYQMFVRPGTSDDLVCDEANSYAPLFMNRQEDDVFLDIGANIGSVTRLASNISPTMPIFAYEPDKENFNMLLTNTKHQAHVTLIKKAVGGSTNDTFLYSSKGSNKGKHSVYNRNFIDGYEKSIVKQVDFRQEIIEHRATRLKIDIEGGEHKLDFHYLPDFVKAIAIEFHLINKNYQEVMDLYHTLEDQFDYVVYDKIPNDMVFLESYIDDSKDAFMKIFLRN